MGKEKAQKQTEDVSIKDIVPAVQEANDALERNKFVYELINKWIENADNKVNTSCALFTGIFSVVTFLAEQYGKEPNAVVINECWKCIHKWSLLLSLLVLAFAIFFYTRAIIPNLKSNNDEGPEKKKYPIFYGDISSLSIVEYKRKMNSGSNRDLFDELVLESRQNSKICTNKMKNYRVGVVASMIAVALAFITLFAQYLTYNKLF